MVPPAAEDLSVELTVLLLVLVSLDVGGLAGSAVSRIERLGFVAIPLGLALALPLLIFWVCLGLLPGSALALHMLFFRVCLGPSPLGEGSVAVRSMTGVLFLVVRW